MRKYIIHLATAAIALVGFVACDVETNEKPGGTAVEQMAGFWDVRVHEVNADGTLTLNVFGSRTQEMEYATCYAHQLRCTNLFLSKRKGDVQRSQQGFSHVGNHHRG